MLFLAIFRRNNSFHCSRSGNTLQVFIKEEKRFFSPKKSETRNSVTVEIKSERTRNACSLTPVTYRREAAPAPPEQRRRSHWRRRQQRRRRRGRAWRQAQQQHPETTAQPSHLPGTSTRPAAGRGGGPRRESTGTAMEVAAASCCSVHRRLPLAPRLFFG
jgi:hypothetical protein